MRMIVTGSDGLVGNAMKELAPSNHEIIFAARKDADLTKENEVSDLFEKYKPDWVVHTAAKVGGIGGNMASHADYFYQNILMNSHVIHHAHRFGVKKLIVFSSVCVFPDNLPCLREDLMHQGEPFTGNFAYAHAKRMVDIQIRAYSDQYNVKNYASIIPGNIFGTHDLYNLTHGHVIPSLIHKVYLAKKNKGSLKVWGDGSSLREFIFSRDLAKCIYNILELENIPQRILISGTKQYSIKEIVEKLCKVADFQGEVIWETDKPNGQRSRPSDLSLLRSLIGDLPQTNIDEALAISYRWFEENYEVVRK